MCQGLVTVSDTSLMRYERPEVLHNSILDEFSDEQH